MTSSDFHNAILTGIKEGHSLLLKGNSSIAQIKELTKALYHKVKKESPETLFFYGDVTRECKTPHLVIRTNIKANRSSHRTLSILLRSDPGQNVMTLIQLFTEDAYTTNCNRIADKHFMYTGRPETISKAVTAILNTVKDYGHAKYLAHNTDNTTPFNSVVQDICKGVLYMKDFHNQGHPFPKIINKTPYQIIDDKCTIVLDTNIPTRKDKSQWLGLHIMGSTDVTVSLLGRIHVKLKDNNKLLNAIRIQPTPKDQVNLPLQVCAQYAAKAQMIAAPK